MKIPAFAYSLMEGRYERFPIELLHPVFPINLDEKQGLGLTWVEIWNDPAKWRLFNNFWYLFKKHPDKPPPLDNYPHNYIQYYFSLDIKGGDDA